MKHNQLTQGQERRVMYLENKNGLIEGARARIGWVTFSKSGKTVYYRGRSFSMLTGSGISGNFYEVGTGAEFWISGIKKRGSNGHPAERTITPIVDDDAQAEYERLRQSL